jgi:hypothetical protein
VCATASSDPLESLLEIGEDVVDVLDADRQPHEVGADAGALELVLGSAGCASSSRDG